MHWTLSLLVSYTASWTTATLFLLVFQLATFNICSPFLTQPYIWSPAHRDAITWPPCCEIATDFLLSGYKLCTIVHRCLYGEASPYLVDLITPSAAASTRAGLRSATSMTITVLCMLSSFGDCSFATAGPHMWNKLPSHLHVMQSADTFRCHLKTSFYFTRLFYHDIVRRSCCTPALMSL